VSLATCFNTKMNLDVLLRNEISKALTSLFSQPVENFQLQPTNPEFEGSHTLVCFPLTKITRKGPEETAKLVGDYLVQYSGLVSKYNVVKGFLNLSLDDKVWIKVIQGIAANKDYGQLPSNSEEIMIEYSSPNTNKPLHLGHLRNNFLGWSVSEIHKANGFKVHKVQIINDRGIHICKSMAAWLKFGDGETPASSGIKGDHLVGKYYVEFDKAHKAQLKNILEKISGNDFQLFNEKEATKLQELLKTLADQRAKNEGEKAAKTEEAIKDIAENKTPMMQFAQELLRKWEAKDASTVDLWKTMNGWVYAGFEETYKKMHVDFDKLYYESDTYLLGKEEVLKGVDSGVFFRKEDGSVWVDLAADGLDQKVLLRSDGTSVYMTQDIGTAILRFKDFPKITGQVYTVGNEQEYHFKVLFLILGKLGFDWAKRCYHLSYGMVDLPTGKMKSREGTVVDADDLIDEMTAEAEKQSRELGKMDEMTDAEAQQLFRIIGLGALKFFLLKVDPKKRMLFDPNESIQLQGFTGPFIQYTHARIKSILRKAEQSNISTEGFDVSSVASLEPAEKDIVQVLSLFENKVREAAREYAPSIIANYVYDLAKSYNQFYQSIPIFNETDQSKLKFRVVLSQSVANAIKKGMHLLGIEVPERM
jgi:arginyl-tRNA synthetase